MRLLRPMLLLLLLLGPWQPALAADEPVGITIADAWARATPPGAMTGVVYLTITDHGAPDRLIRASTPIAEGASLHQSHKEDGMMKMDPVETLPVSSATPVKLAPGGYHLMLTGLKQPLKAGDTFPLTLSFEQAGDVTAEITVRPLGAAAPMGHGGGMEQMKGMDHTPMNHMPGMGKE